MKLVVTLLCFSILVFAEFLDLAKDGRTEYVIVPGGDADMAASEDLAQCLKKASGAEFRVARGALGGKRIVFGDGNTAEGRKGAWWRVSFKDDDIVLDGYGKSGRWNAAHEFLMLLGFRWFDIHGMEAVPSALSVEKADKSGVYPFAIRGNQTFYNKSCKVESDLFHSRNGQNILLFGEAGGGNDELEYDPTNHSFAYFLHPGEKYAGKYEQQGRFGRQLPWIETKNYFELHPEWFPMNEKGERYTHGQLCFSNQELRRELTKNALEQLRREMARCGRDDGIFNMSMNDIVYENFCNCEECLSIGKKYGVPSSGAFYEYLAEFCREVKDKYPKVRVKTCAYMSSLKMPQGIEFPDNLLVIFAPIYSSYIASLEQEKNQVTMKYLEDWRKAGVTIWYWYYTLPYAGGKYLFQPPVSNIGRMTDDIRKLRELGVECMYTEHDSGPHDRTAFFELQSYLLLNLYRNTGSDAWEIIGEYSRAAYGAAADLYLEYLMEVEDGCQAAAKSGMRAVIDTVEFPYINAENLAAWQKKFDAMEKLVQGRDLFSVRLARLCVDSTAITLKASAGGDVSAELENITERLEWLKKNGYAFDMGRLATWRKALGCKPAE